MSKSNFCRSCWPSKSWKQGVERITSEKGWKKWGKRWQVKAYLHSYTCPSPTVKSSPILGRLSIKKNGNLGFLIGDFANLKRHQRLNKILIVYLYHIWEITQVVYKKALSCATPAKLDAILRSACACNCTHMFHIAYAWQEFSCEQLCWFPGCVDKKNIDFVQLLIGSLVAFGISNICYCGLN